MRHSLASSAAAAPFAHLLGLGRKPVAKRAEEDKPEDDKDAARAESEDDDDKDKDGKKGARAEDDEKDDKDAARAEDEDDDADKDKDGKKAKAKAEDDETCAEEDDEDEDVSAAAKAGRKAERARCRNIFSSKAAGQRPDVAAQLAFTTNLSSAEAVGILEAAASGTPTSVTARRIDERMARVVTPSVGADGGSAAPQSGPKGQALAIVAAMNKARGQKA